MIDYVQIGKRIRAYRKKRGLTQEGLAFDINTSAAYVCNIELGKKKPSLQKLAEIAEILDVSVGDLLSGSSTETGLSHNPEDLASLFPDKEQARLLINLAELMSILKQGGRH